MNRYERHSMYAATALQGMLASAPMCDRSKINKKKWAKIAMKWADEMMKSEPRVIPNRGRS